MKIQFSKTAFDQLQYWKRTDERVLKKIRNLIEAINQNPYTGIGKPEPLKHQYRGYWSRRINREHRLIYKLENDTIYIASCRYHYD